MSINITPKDGRKAFDGLRVRVYKNLQRDCYSIVAMEGDNKGLVIGYATCLALTGCTFVVSEAGRQRVVREKRKNVHAYVDGRLSFSPALLSDERIAAVVSYNPYRAAHFCWRESGEAVHASPLVLFGETGRCYAVAEVN